MKRILGGAIQLTHPVRLRNGLDHSDLPPYGAGQGCDGLDRCTPIADDHGFGQDRELIGQPVGAHLITHPRFVADGPRRWARGRVWET